MKPLNIVFMYFFFQAEDGIRDLVRSRGLGDVYKSPVARQVAGASSRAMPEDRKGTVANVLKPVSYIHPTLPSKRIE